MMDSSSAALDFPYAYLQRLGASTNDFSKIELSLPEITVGRGKDNNFIIPDLLVSRKHVTFKTNKDNGWLIESVGMNGTSVNNIVLPKNMPTPLKHSDKIEFGFGGKFVYGFCLKSFDMYAIDGSQRSFDMESRPSAKHSPVAFRSYVQSRKSLERTLMEESVVLDQKVEEQISKKNQLILEQKKLEEHSNKLRKELEARFAEERKALEEKGQLEKSELQKEKIELEERMMKISNEFQEECNRKSSELKQSVEKAIAEKKSLLEQKDIVVQQWLREKNLLQECLEEEKRLREEEKRLKEAAAAAQAAAEAELANSREAICRLKEEKKQLEEKGSAGEARFRQIEELLAAKQREIEDFQSRNLIGLDYYEMARKNVEEGGLQEQAANPSPDVEAEIKRRVTEEMNETMENIAMSMECNICSEPIIVAISLNCAHTFCQYCINQWKLTKNECPSCRTPITFENRHHFIDNIIEAMINKLPEEAKAKRKELVKQRADLTQRQAQATATTINPAVRHVLHMAATGESARAALIAHFAAEIDGRGRVVVRGRRRPSTPRHPVPRPTPVEVASAQAVPNPAFVQPGTNVIRVALPQVVRPAQAANAPAGQHRVQIRVAQARPAAAPIAAAVVEDVVLVESSDDEVSRPTRNTTRRNNLRNRIEDSGDNLIIVRELVSTTARNKRTLCHTCGTTMPVNSSCRFCTT